MTAPDPELHAVARRLLLGRTCVRCGWNGPTPEFDLGQVTLSVYAAWRLVGPDVLLGSDARDVTAQDLELLVGSRVTRVSITDTLHDLRLEFTGGWALQTLTDSAEFENWQIGSAEGELVIAGPSTYWTHFGPKVATETAGEQDYGDSGA